MKPQAAFIGPDCVGVLHAPAAIDLRLASIVLPDHTEAQNAVRYGKPLEHFGGRIIAMGLFDGDGVPGDMAHRLVKFRLAGSGLLNLCHEVRKKVIARHVRSFAFVFTQKETVGSPLEPTVLFRHSKGAMSWRRARPGQ
jgi:hypothetical protein